MKFVESLPNASLQWVEECGHVPHLEQPEQTAQVIRNFLIETFPSRASENSSNTILWGSLAAAVVTAGGVAVELGSNGF